MHTAHTIHSIHHHHHDQNMKYSTRQHKTIKIEPNERYIGPKLMLYYIPFDTINICAYAMR